jgi:uncharacterized iron-regulated membrane protein
MTVFLIVVALTGSLLAFRTEIERLAAPQLFARARSGTPLDPATLIERAQSVDPRVRVLAVSLKEEGRAQLGFRPRIDPATGKRYVLDFNEIFIDPYNGKELGRRRNGDLSQGLVNLMPFIRLLHGDLVWRPTGTRLLGWIAVLWTLDCFVALYLTFPKWRRLSRFDAGRVWLSRWTASWQVTWNRRAFPLNYQLHRAGGLWVWLLMLMFAWSSVYLNLHSVYAPVVGALLDYPAHNNHGGDPRERALAKPVENPALSWRQAQHRAEEELVRAGLTLRRVESLSYSPQLGVYQYRVATNMDIQTTGGRTYVTIDGNTGHLNELRLPSGQHSGLTFTNWIYALHMANVFGLPYRIVVFLSGFALAMLSVTGVFIWWKKLGFRRHAAKKGLTQVASDGTSSKMAAPG